jgi:hypothetical protein
MSMNKISVIVVITLVLILTACSSAASPQVFEMPAMEMPAMEMAEDYGGGYDDEVSFDRAFDGNEKATNAAEGISPATSNGVESSAVQRMVIKNADLSIVVDDPIQKMESIAAMADEMGGFVVDSNIWQNILHNGAKVPHASITIRVLSDRLDEALDYIKSGVGEITSENVSGQDVTSQYTDLASRLRNLEAAETQLQEIMDDAYATEDVLQVYNNLVSVREQIEVIKGQMEYFEEAAKLSRISVDITGDEEAQPLQIGGWEPAGVAKQAIEAMINTLQWLGDVAIWVVLCVLPIGIIIGIPLFFIVRYGRRLRKRSKTRKAADKDVVENSVENTISNESDL